MGESVVKEYSIEEQKIFSEEKRKELRDMKLVYSKNEIRFLGLDLNDYSVSYYIGVDWLQEKTSCIVVRPKIKNLDYVKMFVHCLKHPTTFEFLKDAYYFDSKKEKIPIDTAEWDLTPFMIVHFIALVEQITEQGLEKNYIVVEDNLNSKIKGKIVFAQQLKKNIVVRREDRIYCRFQEYSVNCLENRLLKKTLLFIKRYSAKYLGGKYPELIRKENQILAQFENVEAEISYSEIQRVKVNALYKEYVEAVELAKQILKHFGYSYKKAGDKVKELPPFRIDMSKLFELYVYSLLEEAYPKSIQYQEYGKYGYVDFLKKDEELIIDAKYKKIYDSEKNEYEIDDIRQLAGYARDWGVLKKLGVCNSEKVVNCIIIYPDNKNSAESFENTKLLSEDNKIEQFTKFYKCGIKLPVKK
jgi:5-methylcytosine-specific restriction enzyme subunit McrC